MSEIEFKAKGYLKGTRLDKEGAKTVTFEFNASEAVELAKLELMGRDIKNYLPVLLEIRVKQNGGKESNQETQRRKAIKDKLNKFRTS